MSTPAAPAKPAKGRRELIGGRFQPLKFIAEGTYGSVFASRDKNSGNLVALKRVKIRNGKEGIDPGTIQEIRQLAELNHPNICRYIGCFPHKGTLYIANEFIPNNLLAMIHPNDKKKSLSLPDIKCIMRQLLTGMNYLHENWILHRDIKPANIMLDENGVLKLIDFGLSCDFPSDFGEMNPEAVTHWYRPPELFFGATNAGPAVDMWSIGCVFAEMILSRPLFPGANNQEVIQGITNLLGPLLWPGCDKLPNFVETRPAFPIIPLKQTFNFMSLDGIDLLAKLLEIDPTKRISAAEALNHPYFSCPPEETIPTSLPLPETASSLSALSALSGLHTGFTALTRRTILAPGTALLRHKEKNL